MFRCPHCAKVYRLPISPNHSILANHDMNKYWVIEDTLFNEGAKQGKLVKQFAAMLTEVSSIKEAQLYVGSESFTNELMVELPCCGHMTDIDTAIDAFEHPEMHFEEDNLCGCGGELWMDRLRSGRYAQVCERCGWIRPAVVVSGSGDVNAT